MTSQANPSTASETESFSDIERRIGPRYPLLQKCFVWPQGSQRVEPWRCIVYNISLNGLGIAMPFPPQPGTVLQVQAWGMPAAPILEVHVLRSTPVEFLWFCGCELSKPLTSEELQLWLSKVGAG